MQNRWCHVIHLMLYAHPYMNMHMKLVDYDYGMACHGCHHAYDDDAAFSVKTYFSPPPLSLSFAFLPEHSYSHWCKHTHTCTLYSQIAVWIVVANNLLDVHDIIVCWLTSSVATFMLYFKHTHTDTLSHEHIHYGGRDKYKVSALIHWWRQNGNFHRFAKWTYAQCWKINSHTSHQINMISTLTQLHTYTHYTY